MFRQILGSRVELENSTFWTTLWKLLGEQSPARQQVRNGKKGLRKIPQANQVCELTTGCHCPDGKPIGELKRNIFIRVTSLF